MTQQDYTSQYEEVREIKCNRCFDTGVLSDGDCPNCLVGSMTALGYGVPNANGDVLPKMSLIVTPEAKHIDLMRKTIKLLMDQPGDKTDETVQLIVELVATVKGHEKGLTKAIEKQTGIGSAGQAREDGELQSLASRLANDFDMFEQSRVERDERRGPMPRGQAVFQMTKTLYLILKNLKG